MKKYIVSITVNIEVEAEDQYAANDQFFDATISIKYTEGKEIDWTFINHETFKA